MAQLLYRPRGNNEMKKSAGECFRAADNQRKSISDISRNGRASSKTFILTRGRILRPTKELIITPPFLLQA
jgi:hypothetical protein